MSNEYITDKVKAIIGAQTDWAVSTHPVEASEVRRFHHATMDDARRYWDEDWAATSRYGSVVAPPGFPVHAFRRPPHSADPLDDMNKPDYDGLSRSFSGLPAVEVELPRDLNGGYEYELYRYARVGEKVLRQARYKDIVQRDGSSGPMVLVIIEETYTTEAGEKLLKVTNTQIMRQPGTVMRTLCFEDVEIGMEIPHVVKGPMTTAHIVRWSASMENWHRIHYDWRFATGHDKLPDVMVNGSWKQHVMLQLLTDWVGESGWAWKLKFQFRGMNVPGDVITAWGRVTGREQRGGYGLVHLEIGLRNQEGKESTPGTATVILPLRHGAPVPYPFDPAVLEEAA